MSRWTKFHDLRVFLAAVRRHPAAVGAIAPSGLALARLLATVVPSTGAPTAVELGPGTGSVTKAVQRRIPAAGRHLAVEIDANLVEHLRSAHPRLDVIHGDAAELAELLADCGVEEVDAVISSLPWSLFPEELQQTILGQASRALTPAGVFTSFAYVHAVGMKQARNFRALLDRSFDEVIVSNMVWTNVPPAVIYVCRRPILGGHPG